MKERIGSGPETDQANGAAETTAYVFKDQVLVQQIEDATGCTKPVFLDACTKCTYGPMILDACTWCYKITLLSQGNNWM